jgi:hypothetical protein
MTMEAVHQRMARHGRRPPAGSDEEKEFDKLVRAAIEATESAIAQDFVNENGGRQGLHRHLRWPGER